MIRDPGFELTTFLLRIPPLTVWPGLLDFFTCFFILVNHGPRSKNGLRYWSQIVGGGSNEQNICPTDQNGAGAGASLTVPSGTTITKARSEMDLKTSNEDTSLPFYRRPHRKHLDLPRRSPPPPVNRDGAPRPESPLEEAESQDQVCRLVAPILLATSGLHHPKARSSPDIEFPPTIVTKNHFPVWKKREVLETTLIRRRKEKYLLALRTS